MKKPFTNQRTARHAALSAKTGPHGVFKQALREWINKIATHDSVRSRTLHNHLESAPKIARSGDRAYNGARIAVFPVGRVPSRGDFVDLQNRLLEPI